MEVRKHRQESSRGGAATAGGSAGASTSTAHADDHDDDDMFPDPLDCLPAHRQKVKTTILAGNLKADRQNLKVAELDVLFQEPKLEEGGDATAPVAASGPSRVGAM